MYDSLDDDWIWDNISPEDLWVYDKLLLAKKCSHKAAPIGIDVPRPDWYIVRPCVHVLGFGLGAKKYWIEKNTENFPLGFFWCEWFEGRHLSVDYLYGKPILTVEGHKSNDNGSLTYWEKWIRTSDTIQLPSILANLKKYQYVNCEFIGGKLIEVHFRHNPDFRWNQREYIPVWQGQSTIPPNGYQFVEDAEVHGRVGAFIK